MIATKRRLLQPAGSDLVDQPSERVLIHGALTRRQSRASSMGRPSQCRPTSS
jgi:hypothetical protein